MYPYKPYEKSFSFFGKNFSNISVWHYDEGFQMLNLIKDSFNTIELLCEDKSAYWYSITNNLISTECSLYKILKERFDFFEKF